MLGDLPTKITDIAKNALKDIPEEEINKMSYKEVSNLVLKELNLPNEKMEIPHSIPNESGKPVPMDISKIFTVLMEGAETIMSNQNLGFYYYFDIIIKKNNT